MWNVDFSDFGSWPHCFEKLDDRVLFERKLTACYAHTHSFQVKAELICLRGYVIISNYLTGWSLITLVGFAEGYELLRLLCSMPKYVNESDYSICLLKK